MALYGQVYGLGGTDDLRRDLMVALLWGTRVALDFGFLSAITTGLLSMMIAAVGVWFGGWVDSIIQRLTELNMILLSLPIALTRGAFQRYYYWVLEPVALMILTGLAFAVVGFALDSILNPRLRRI